MEDGFRACKARVLAAEFQPKPTIAWKKQPSFTGGLEQWFFLTFPT